MQTNIISTFIQDQILTLRHSFLFLIGLSVVQKLEFHPGLVQVASESVVFVSFAFFLMFFSTKTFLNTFQFFRKSMCWGGYNRVSIPAVRPAKIYLARPVPVPVQTTTPAPVYKTSQCIRHSPLIHRVLYTGSYTPATLPLDHQGSRCIRPSV